MPIKVPVTQTGLEQSIQNAASKAGKNLKINMGPGAKSVEGLTRPLGRLTGRADEFTKSMEAANARVLAFGASVGVIAAVSNGLKQLVTTSIQVEKSLTNINSILKQSESQLDGFKNQIFDIARNTGQTFDIVAEAALELSRQGLKAEEVTKRLNDALVLSRLSGLSAADSVAGLTAAVNSFSKAGLTTSDVLNKISAAAASAAVSDRDLIEGLKRSGAVAVASGVKFDELIGIISALQERTARGGAVIGNSLKTIFVRIQDLDRLQSIQRLGVEVTDLGGQVLSSSKIIENLAPTFAKLDQASRVNLADNLVGKFQIAPFLALLEDYNQKVSRSGEVASTSFGATNEAYERNKTLNTALAAAINAATVSVKELANALGEIGVTENLSKIIGVFNSVVSSITNILDGDGMGSAFAKGLIKGISAVIAGPGLALALVAIGKLLLDFAKFGTKALGTFFGLNKAAEAQRNLQGQIAASLLNDKGIRSAILSIEKQNISEGEKKKLQTAFFTKALNEQLMVMQKMQGIARTIAPGVMAGTASTRGGRRGRAAGGFLPIGAEKSDISRGVGGAPASAKPVVIPNFAFGGGKRGTMVANSSEYIVPNYANGGDAIFNQNMASSMGLPANARKVRAASGYIPNFVNKDERLVLFTGDKGGDFKKIFHVGKTKANETRAYASKASAPKGMRTTPVTVPTYRMKGGKADSEPKDIEFIKKRLSNTSTDAALKFAKDLSGKSKLPNLSKKKIQGLFNPGSFEGMSGTIFEVAIASILNSREFADYAARHSNARIDLPYSPRLFGKFGAKGKGTLGAEVKANSGLASSAAIKFYDILVGGGQVATYKDNKFLGKTLTQSQFKKLYKDGIDGKKYGAVQKMLGGTVTRGGARNLFSRSASGYIPNFAEGALEDAIGREKSAGLPVSQIRINQSGKLRNSQNPMGLAVTNTRDEPTGAIPAARGFIPNYNILGQGVSNVNQLPASQQITQIGNAAEKSSKAIDKSTSSTKKSGGGLDKLTGKLFAFQSIMFLFQSGVGGMAEESTGATKTLMKFSQAAMQAVMALTAFQMLGGVSGLTGLAGKGAAMQTRGSRMIQAGRRLPRVTGGGIRQGMKGAGVMASGAMTVFGGALLKLVAPLAIVAAGFGALVAINNLVTGSSEANKKALDELTAAQKKATKVSKNLNVGDKEEFAEINRKLANADVEFFLSQMNSMGKMSTGPFMGADDEIKIQRLRDQIIASYDAGQTQAESRSKLSPFIAMANRETNFLDPTARSNQGDFVGGTLDRLERKLSETVQKGKLTGDQFVSLLKSFSRSMVDRSPRQREFESILRGKDNFDQKSDSGKKLIERFRKPETVDGKFSPALPQESVDASIIGVQAEKDEKIRANRIRVDRITLANAKSRLQTAIEVRKENLKLLSADDKRLMKAQAFETLDDNSLLALKQRIEIQKIDNDLASKNLDFLNAQGDEMTRLKVEKGKIGDIENEILNISKEDLKDKDRLLGIVNKIFHTNGLEKEVADSISKSLIIQLDKNESLADASKLVLRNRQGETTELTKQKQLIKEIQAGTALTAQTELFASTNEASSERAKIEKNIKAVEARRDRIPANDREKERLTGVITSLRQKLNTVDSDQRKATIQSDARSLFSRVPESVRTRFPEAMKAMQDPNADPLKILRSLDTSSDEKSRQIQAGMQALNAPFQLQGNPLPTEDIIKLKTELGKLEQKITEDKQATEDATQATKDNSIVIAESSKINQTMAQVLAPFSRSESADASRRAEAEANVAAGTDKSGGSVDLELRRLTMERDVGTRFFELVPTDLENADKLSQSLADSSFQFAHNIGDAMLDAIQKGENLGDILLGTAADFLATMSRAFMDSAVNDFLGGFGIGKPDGRQAGGPIRGGSGTKDDVPAMLMGGEFVMNKKAVKKYGMGFMSALNTGSMQGFSKGGQVRDREGMFTTPGMNGAGKIVGMKDLMSFATQSPMAMNRDTIDSSGAFLDAESGRLSMFGRRNSPQFQRVQDAKRQAFGLFVSEMEAHRQAAEQQKANKEGLMDSLKAGAISLAAGAAMKSMATGFKNARDAGASIPESFKASVTGFDVMGDGTKYGGLTNLFSAKGFQSGPPKAQIVNQGAVGIPKAQIVNEGAGGIAFNRNSGGNPPLGVNQLPSVGGPSTRVQRAVASMGGGGIDFGRSILPTKERMPIQYSLDGIDFSDPKVGFMEQRATGGLIPAAGGVDTVPAMLSGGEFVMNAAATKNIGAGNLQALNSGAGTGDNTDLVSKLDELIAATETSQSTGDINITINGSNGAETETQGQNSTDQQKMLSDKIKTAVKQVIADEKRLGGQLRR